MHARSCFSLLVVGLLCAAIPACVPPRPADDDDDDQTHGDDDVADDDTTPGDDDDVVDDDTTPGDDDDDDTTPVDDDDVADDDDVTGDDDTAGDDDTTTGDDDDTVGDDDDSTAGDDDDTMGDDDDTVGDDDDTAAGDPTSLWIELTWVMANDDMDLHLLAPNGSLETDSDCYYANCWYGSLDWGVTGVIDDDPWLILDDIYGTGPEQTSLPVPSDGLYTVVVHDYPGSSYKSSNDATVEISVGGSVAATYTYGMVGEDCYWWAATIDVQAGVVTVAPDGNVVCN